MGSPRKPSWMLIIVREQRPEDVDAVKSEVHSLRPRVAEIGALDRPPLRGALQDRRPDRRRALAILERRIVEDGVVDSIQGGHLLPSDEYVDELCELRVGCARRELVMHHILPRGGVCAAV